MKILYLLTEPFGVGGVQSDMLALVPGLTARGHEVAVATTPGERLPDLLRLGGRFLELSFQFNKLPELVRCARALGAAAAAEKFDLVAPQSIRTSMAAWVALRLLPRLGGAPKSILRVPIVTTIHNVHDPRNFDRAGWILRLCSDFVLFESNYERNRLLARGLPAERSKVIFSGIDSDRFRSMERRQDIMAKVGLSASHWPVFCMVARMSEEKGHSILLSAFSRVLSNLPSSRLLLVGDGPLLQDVKRTADQLGISEAVIFAGMQRDVPAYLSVADIFVLSSTRESFPLSAREAMSAGLPAILPNIGGCPEVVESGVSGLLFDAGNAQNLAEKMQLAADRASFPAMKQAAQSRARALFSREAWIDGDEEVYEAALARCST